jgi:hypothetical protein
MLDSDCIEEKSRERFFELKESLWVLYFSDAAQTFIAGLIAFQIYRETRKTLWLERGRKCKADMKLWTDQGSLWNFQHKFLLLDAEEHFSNGIFKNAQVCYNKAIESAKSHKFINDEALACELAAKFFWGIGDFKTSLKNFRLAHEKYVQWGAIAKADRLVACINQKFSNIVGNKSVLSPINVGDAGALTRQCVGGTDHRKRRAA